nr:uncharacterized protein LOC109765897 [Aegilops tauschii subsp. strangulata]
MTIHGVRRVLMRRYTIPAKGDNIREGACGAPLAVAQGASGVGVSRCGRGRPSGQTRVTVAAAAAARLTGQPRQEEAGAGHAGGGPAAEVASSDAGGEGRWPGMERLRQEELWGGNDERGGQWPRRVGDTGAGRGLGRRAARRPEPWGGSGEAGVVVGGGSEQLVAAAGDGGLATGRKRRETRSDAAVAECEDARQAQP